MIAGISGKVIGFSDASVTVQSGALAYEVYVPASVHARILENQKSNGEISLITYHYYQMTPSSATPVLVGFLNTIERDFFLEFIKVSGIGPKAAVKALSKSIGEIAQAIDRGDVKYLTTLPGIGAQRAKEVVAKLQGKMGKFTLMQDKVREIPKKPEMSSITEETLHVLTQLQYRKPEALEMIEKALIRNASISTSEELLNEIYKQRTPA